MGTLKKPIAAIGVFALAVIAATGFTFIHLSQAAQTAGATTTTGSGSGKHGWNMTKPAASGTVSAISGNTITLAGKNGTSYSVDASNATIQKFSPPASGTAPATKPAPLTITVSQIQVGDNLTVQGTVSGTSIVATKISDGLMGFGGLMGTANREVPWARYRP